MVKRSSYAVQATCVIQLRKNESKIDIGGRVNSGWQSKGQSKDFNFDIFFSLDFWRRSQEIQSVEKSREKGENFVLASAR